MNKRTKTYDAIIALELESMTPAQRAEAENTLIPLRETSLSRVLSHFNEEGYPVGIISAFRKDKDREYNVQSNRMIAANANSNRWGYVWVDGGWLESQKGTDEKVHVSEDSVLIIGSEKDQGQLLDFLLKQAQEYEQDAFTYKNKDAEVSILSSSGDRVVGPFTGVTLQKLADGYTQLRGRGERTFSFTEAWCPEGAITHFANRTIVKRILTNRTKNEQADT